MNGKIILMILALWSPHLMNARSPLQFSGRSLLNKDQRAALLKLVQGPSSSTSKAEVKKSESVVVKPRVSNEVQSRIPDGVDFDGDGQLDSEGCMKKVVMVEEVEFDTEIKCQHVSQESCFESYTTTFKKTKMEECDESFKKECEIEYHKVPKEEKVEICNEMLTRECGVDGPEVCSKEYETVCETIYEEHTVNEEVPDCSTTLEEICMPDDAGEMWCDNVPQRKCTIKDQTSVKLTPKTECRKEVAQVCGPETCPIVKGDRICKDEIKTVIHEVPQESCTMVPRKVCNIVSKVVPTLEPVKHCIDIPKEMCAKSRINPVRKTRPVVRKWCLSDNNDAADDGVADTVYVVSSVNDVGIGGTTAPDSMVRAFLVDAKTGLQLEGCSKQFNAFNYGYYGHDGHIFGLIGDQRQLVSCGSLDGTCFNHDFVSGDVVTSSNPSATNGPFYYAASFIDSISSRWMTIKGTNGVGNIDETLHMASTSTDFDNLAFTEEDLTVAFPGVQFGITNCLLRFSSPGGPVTFVATTPADVTAFAIKRGDGELKTNYDDNADFVEIVGNHPICGYSVVNEAGGASGGQVGDTIIYFFTKGTSGPVNVHTVLVPTSSEDAMNTFFSEGNTVEPQTEAITFLDNVNRVPVAPDVPPGQFARAAATVWLGDNRSLVLPSNTHEMWQFDANTGNFSPLDEPVHTTRQDNTGVLFACRATQQDRENMGCA